MEPVHYYVDGAKINGILLSDIKSKDYSHKKKVLSIGWSSSGNNFASASYDSSIKLWNLDHKDLYKVLDFKGHTDQVDQIAWHPTAENILGEIFPLSSNSSANFVCPLRCALLLVWIHVASASHDKTLRIWDTRSSKAFHTEKTKSSNINLAWNPEGTIVAVGKESAQESAVTRTGTCRE